MLQKHMSANFLISWPGLMNVAGLSLCREKSAESLGISLSTTEAAVIDCCDSLTQNVR